MSSIASCGAGADRRARGVRRAPQLRGALARILAGAEVGERRHRGDERDRQRGRERGQPQRLVRPEQADRHQRADHRDRHEVDRALDLQERDRAPRDLLVGHPLAVQDPGAEREPARPARRDQRADGQLGERDLGRRPPRQPRAEDGAEHQHVRRAGERLEHDPEREPGRVGVAEPLLHLLEPRRQQRREHEHRQQRDDQAEAPDEAPRGELVRQAMHGIEARPVPR